jgi:hypothetical protein
MGDEPVKNVRNDHFKNIGGIDDHKPSVGDSDKTRIINSCLMCRG